MASVPGEEASFCPQPGQVSVQQRGPPLPQAPASYNPVAHGVSPNPVYDHGCGRAEQQGHHDDDGGQDDENDDPNIQDVLGDNGCRGICKVVHAGPLVLAVSASTSRRRGGSAAPHGWQRRLRHSRVLLAREDGTRQKATPARSSVEARLPKTPAPAGASSLQVPPHRRLQVRERSLPGRGFSHTVCQF